MTSGFPHLNTCLCPSHKDAFDLPWSAWRSGDTGAGGVQPLLRLESSGVLRCPWDQIGFPEIITLLAQSRQRLRFPSVFTGIIDSVYRWRPAGVSTVLL